jgi:hypothetical protein
MKTIRSKLSDVIQTSTMITLQLLLDWVLLSEKIKEVVLITHNSSFDRLRLAGLLLHYDRQDLGR